MFFHVKLERNITLSIEAQTGCDPMLLAPVRVAPALRYPAVFISSESDPLLGAATGEAGRWGRWAAAEEAEVLHLRLGPLMHIIDKFS